MLKKIDEGKILVEHPIAPKGKTEIEIYNELYFNYVTIIREALYLLETELKYMVQGV